MQKQVYDTCRERKDFSLSKLSLGYYEGENEQINTILNDSNMAMETLLLKCQPDGESQD